LRRAPVSPDQRIGTAASTEKPPPSSAVTLGATSMVFTPPQGERGSSVPP
jgi:hypothetical protein